MQNLILLALRRITNKLDSDFSGVYEAIADGDIGTLIEQLQEANESLLRMGRKYRNLLLVGIEPRSKAIVVLNRCNDQLEYRNSITFAVEASKNMVDLQGHQSRYVRRVLGTQIGVYYPNHLNQSWIDHSNVLVA